VELADEALKKGRFAEAKSLYLRGAYVLLGKESPIVPLKATKNGGGKQWDIYTYMNPAIKESLLNCYNRLGLCSIGLVEIVEVFHFVFQRRFT